MEKKLPVLCIDILELERFEFAVKNERKNFVSCVVEQLEQRQHVFIWLVSTVTLETKQLLSFVHV